MGLDSCVLCKHPCRLVLSGVSFLLPSGWGTLHVVSTSATCSAAGSIASDVILDISAPIQHHLQTWDVCTWCRVVELTNNEKKYTLLAFCVGEIWLPKGQVPP